MRQRASEPKIDSNDIAARYGFEREITSAVQDVRVPQTFVSEAMVAEYKRLINDCYVMKGTLFNASKRLMRKHIAGQFTFALSGVYGFLVPLFALQFEPFLTALVTNIVSFTAATAGAISFVVALIYQQQSLSRKASEFHDAGLKINKLRRQLQAAPLTNAQQLTKANDDYYDIFLSCDNHEEIDYEYGKLSARPKDNKDGRLDTWIKQRRRLDIRFFLYTYSGLLMVWLVPPIVAFSIWLSMSGNIETVSQIAR